MKRRVSTAKANVDFAGLQQTHTHTHIPWFSPLGTRGSPCLIILYSAGQKHIHKTGAHTIYIYIYTYTHRCVYHNLFSLRTRDSRASEFHIIERHRNSASLVFAEKSVPRHLCILCVCRLVCMYVSHGWWFRLICGEYSSLRTLA
jgi:hypothetical protein